MKDVVYWMAKVVGNTCLSWNRILCRGMNAETDDDQPFLTFFKKILIKWRFQNGRIMMKNLK